MTQITRRCYPNLRANSHLRKEGASQNIKMCANEPIFIAAQDLRFRHCGRNVTGHHRFCRNGRETICTDWAPASAGVTYGGRGDQTYVWTGCIAVEIV